jgi:hypothetical protein
MGYVHPAVAVAMAQEQIDRQPEEVTDPYKEESTCTCHHESGNHELCCGFPEGVNPDCEHHGNDKPLDFGEVTDPYGY